jgi:L-lactate dehydrogenase complex protein LldG
MTSKQQILNAIRQHKVPEAELPDHAGPWIVYENPIQQFSDALRFVGGRPIPVENEEHLARELAGLPQFASAIKSLSLVPGIGVSNVDLDRVEDPHELADIDTAILPGQFGVAENGSVWVTGDAIRHRVIYFIVQHLALVLPASQIVPNMHVAYQRLSFHEPSFGVFISGPSKTADIEQSMVIGAHGPRSMTVFIETWR